MNNRRHHPGVVAGTSEEAAWLVEDEEAHDAGSVSPFHIRASGKSAINAA